ncbi:MAG: hypothetical protein IJW46_03660 [Clostridia bacterium]|nr:hypothetical protein [Clostridia bacterium]
MKKKIILSSILSIVLCLSLIAGSTLALFTSTSKVNIAVNSAKVNVVASISELKTYSLEVEQASGTFENGGTATITEEQTLILENITPGDKATFNVAIANNSNVKTAYRIRTYTEGGLAGGLVSTVTVDGTDIKLTGVDALTAWYELPVDGANIPVSIALPVEAGNEYQEQTATVIVVVEAIQGNGKGTLYVGDAGYDNWDDAIAAAGANGTIKLSGTVDLPQNLAILDGMTVTGIGFATTTFTSVYSGSITFKNITFTGKTHFAMKDTQTATFENCTFLSAVGEVSQSVAANLSFKNCVFKGRFHIDKAAAGSTFLMDGCQFTSTGFFKLGAGFASSTVKNTVFSQVPADASIWSYKGVISYNPISFENCEFNNRLVLVGAAGMAANFTNCTMNGGEEVFFDNSANDIIGGGNVPTVTINGVEIILNPTVDNTDRETYEGDLFDTEFTNGMFFQNESLVGDATITLGETYQTVALEGVTADVNGNLITASADNTIILHDCDFTLDEGEMLIVTTGGATVGQVMIHNVTVNGVLLTQETASQYMQGVNWYEVW